MQEMLPVRCVRASLVLGLVCLAVAGCGKTVTPIDVTGKVVFAVPRPKAPLAINLHPLDDANKTCAPSDVLDETGGFTLKQCLPGRYKATIIAPPLSVGGASSGPGGVGAAPSGPGVEGLPRDYFDVQASPWEVVVSEGGKAPLVLTLSPR